jgi:acetyl esterase/lipase
MKATLLIIAVVLFASALSGIALLRIRQLIPMILHWLLGWIAQAFAPQLIAVCGLAAAWIAIHYSPTPFFWGTEALYIAAAWMFMLCHRRGHASSAVLTRALASRKLCGPAANNAVPQTNGAHEHELIWAGLRPFHWPRAAVECIRNVPYADAGRFNLLDIYRPRNAGPGLLPVIIEVPGGAWVTGNKDQQALPLLHHLAAHGWLCFSINYRLGPAARFPGMLEDVLRAIAWVKQNAMRYGGDTGFVALTGGSAGGHLASLAGLLKERGEFQPGFEAEDTRVSAVVPFYGRYDFVDRHNLLGGDELKQFLEAKVMPCSPKSDPKLWDIASPIAQVHADAPPFFILHGTHDTFIPIEEARAFCDALKGVSKNEVIYAELPGAQHAFDLVRSSCCAHAVLAVQRYLDAEYYRSRQS